MIITIPSLKGGTVTMIGSLPEPTRTEPDLETLGEPSEAALRVVEQLDRLGTQAGSGKPSTERGR